MSDAISHSEHMVSASPAASTAQGRVDRAMLALIAVERTHMSMVVTDPNQPDNPIILANQAFLNLTGYAASDIIGRNCRFMQGPGTSAATLDIIRDAIRREVEATEEILNYRKDGSAYWNALHISPIHDNGGRLIYFFGSHFDVTGRHRARELERSELGLLKEIDHRANNALALVQGIVRLSRADDPRRYARAVQRRVAALANAHALLAGAAWRQVPLEVLLRSELAAAGAGQVDLSGPPLGVVVDHVQPIALVLHEIVSNAVEHGALSSPSGQLAIDWRLRDDAVAIAFYERGGPPPAMAAKGFGLAMAETIVSKQMNGTLEFDWQANGLTTRLTLPATVTD